MKLSFPRLSLSLLIIVNLFQWQTCYPFFNDQQQIQQQLYNATQRVLTTILPPLCYEILFNTNNIQSQYISPQGLIGRIIPAGTFTTPALALEYLYGLLCPIPGLPPRDYTIQAFNLTNVAYDKNYFITQNEFIFTLDGNIRLTFFVNIAFDENYKVCGYEGQIRNLGLTLDPAAYQDPQGSIAALCAATQQFCTGTLQQYASVEACIEYLSTQVPYGTYDRADQGNVICRFIHIQLVPITPSVHCPHVGPTGGNACYNKTVDFYYNQTNFLGCAYKYC
jgi:hypothetical protein